MKRFQVVLLNNKIVSNQQLAEELHKPLITCIYALGCSKLWKAIINQLLKNSKNKNKKKNTDTHSSLKDNTWGADLRDMQILNKFDCSFKR